MKRKLRYFMFGYVRKTIDPVDDVVGRVMMQSFTFPNLNDVDTMLDIGDDEVAVVSSVFEFDNLTDYIKAGGVK